jgi:hypothetical protein
MPWHCHIQWLYLVANSECQSHVMTAGLTDLMRLISECVTVFDQYRASNEPLRELACGPAGATNSRTARRT